MTGTRVLASAVLMVRAWAWLYTIGIADDARRARRNEIDSDLWDSIADARGRRESDHQTALQIGLRLALGVGDDVLWRLVDAPGPMRRPAVWWATTAATLVLLTAAAIVVAVAAPAKLPHIAAPNLLVRPRMPPPPPPPPPPPDRLRAER